MKTKLSQGLFRCSRVYVAASIVASGLASTVPAWADITVYIRPVAGSPNQITISQNLVKSNGERVTSIDDLPEGIRTSPWAQQTTGREHLRLKFLPGTYALTRPWKWTSAESGRVDSQLFIEATIPRQVIITGATRFVVPQTTHQGQALVTVNRAGTPLFEQLWVNNMRAVRARSPNVGSFYYIDSAVTAWNNNAIYNDSEGKPASQHAFNSEPAVIAQLSGLTPAQLSKAVLVAAQAWTSSHHRIAEWNTRNEIRVTPRAAWPFAMSEYGAAQRYFIENLPSALDAPAEWYLDGNNVLSYRPTDAQKQTDLTFDAPVLTQLMLLEGNASANTWVDYINIDGIVFRHAKADLPAAGYVDIQAAVNTNIPSAIQLDRARNVRFNNVEVSRVGGYAIWMRKDVMASSVENSLIYDTGAGGVKIGEETSPNTTGQNKVLNSKIHSIGHQFPGAVGVWIGKSSGNVVEGNLIGDTTYSGISAGWQWNFDITSARDNEIRRNFLFNVMQGVSDGAGIYTLGRSPGTKITGNVVKNSFGFSSYGSGAWGIYNDEGSSEILVSSNIVHNTRSGGYMLHMASELTVNNNVFSAGGLQELLLAPDTGAKPYASFSYNALLPKVNAFVNVEPYKAPSFVYTGNRVGTQFTSAPAVSACNGGGCTMDATLSLAPGNLLDRPTINGSPAVTSTDAVASSWPAQSFAYTTSPAAIWQVPDAQVKRRILNFDATDATDPTTATNGVRFPFGSTPSFLAVQAHRPGEPLGSDGKLPNHSELVSIVSDGAGGRCVAFKDSTGLKDLFEPYARVALNYTSGTSQVKFRLRPDAATEFIHQWRVSTQATSPTGPDVRFSGSVKEVTIKVGSSTVVAKSAPNEWIDVTVTSVHGATPSWTLQLKGKTPSNTALDSTTVYTGLAPNWVTGALFFISNAAGDSTPCVASLTASNTP